MSMDAKLKQNFKTGVIVLAVIYVFIFLVVSLFMPFDELLLFGGVFAVILAFCLGIVYLIGILSPPAQGNTVKP